MRFRDQIQQALRDGLSQPELLLLMERVEDLDFAFRQELEEVKFYHVQSSLVDFYETCQFSEALRKALPNALYDMQEAGRNYALGRAMGCAFHCLRLIECGWKLCARKLRLGHCASWGAFVRKVDQKIQELEKLKKKRRSRTAIKRLDNKLLILAELRMAISSIARVWRNPTMHFDRLPRVYSLDEIPEVFATTRRFLDVAVRDFS